MEQIMIAMAKGRTANKAMKILARAGINFADYCDESRKLTFNDESGMIKMLNVKAVDVPTYVEKGATDIGVIGKDVLLESPCDVYELADLGIGRCKVVVAGFPHKRLRDIASLTIATKYPNIAKQFFSRRGVRADIIPLNGSIELAPLIGLADVIVDIVETGTTLKENGLVILEEIADVSARLIVNKASYAMKTERLQELIEAVKAEAEVLA